MFTVFLVLITIVAVLLIIVIMIQNPKGGGLDSSLGGSTSIGGVQNTNKFLDKSTWTLAAALVILILVSSLSFQGDFSSDSKILDPNTAVPAPAALPTAGAAQGEAQPAQNTPSEQAPATAPAQPAN